MHAIKVEWSDKLNLNIMEIDVQHIKFVETIEELGEVIENNPTPEKIKEMFEKIFAYEDLHFATEEKYFRLFEYPEADKHTAQHQLSRATVKNFKTEYEKTNSIFPIIKLQEFLWSWITTHIMTYDVNYIECFKAHGL